jgi:predicted SAM-dependent methyltransferase
VRFLGEVDEDALIAAYRDADVFVGPSTYESFGLVHAEAMMMGLPVVACAAGGVRELVVDGETGLLVPVGDEPALADALSTLVGDRKRRRAMGAAARKRYEAHFTLEHAVERTAAAYDAVAARHPRAAPDAADLARRLADPLERVVARPAPEARALAEAILAGPDADPLLAIATLWQAASDAEFVDGLYQAVLGRAAEEPQRTLLIDRLRGGMHRGELVREVGWSAEAQARPQGTAWLGRMLELDGWREEDAARCAFSRPQDERFAQDIVDLLVRDAGARELGRRRVLERLAAGADRLTAALSLLDSRLPLRAAPDFDGWQPLLATIAAQATAPPPPAGNGAPPLTQRLRSRVGAARRASGELKQVFERVRATEIRSQDLANAAGRMELQLREQQARADQLEAQLAEMRQEIEAVRLSAAAGDAALRRSLEENAARAADHMRMTDLLMRKLDGMAVELRDRLPPSLATAHLPEPKIVGELRSTKVNLGCGEKPLPGYVNVDARPLPGVDVVADARRLPFEPGSLSELASAHLIEHFRQAHLETVVLPYWRSLLRPDGVLRIICPNWEVMLRRVVDGSLSWQEYKLLTFGLQDYEGDDHFAMYTPDTLAETLRAAGFTNVDLVVADRQNGICPEMEVTATPAPA